MKLFTILLFSAFISITSNAQQITGNVKDADGTPLNGATITLIKDSSIAKLNVSKNGIYSFSNIKEGNYRIKATHVGYNNAVSAPFKFSGNDVQVPDIKLSKVAGTLKEVAVNNQKPIVELKADKMVVNVEGTINSVGSDALDLLRKSPGIVVDKDENITMLGKTGVQVYIDGRQTPLSGQDLATYLKSIQSSNIESIELITNPSAKYDAAGNAGIINIRLKKNKSLGLNGSVNAGWNQGYTAKFNAGTSLNYRNKKINIFGNYGYNTGKQDQSFSLYRTILDSAFDQNIGIHFKALNHNFKVGTDYFIDKKNTIGFIFNATFADPQVNNESHTVISYLPTNTVNRILVANNTNSLKRHNMNINLNYTYINPDGRNLTVNADHGTYNLNSDQYQPNLYYNPSGTTVISSVIYQMIAPTNIDINSVKADWEQNFHKGKLAFGGKTAFVNTDNNFKKDNVSSSLQLVERNGFVYKENINAGYLSFNKAFKGFMIQAGVRVENTVAKGTSTGLKNVSGTYINYDSAFNRNYTDVFPSASLVLNKNPKNQLTFSYTRRIDRPAYQDLNPFEFKLDEYTFQKGNINLKPQYTNSYSIINMYKFKLTTTLNYSHVKDMFVQLADTTEKSKAFLSKRNLATQDIVSINITYPIQYKKFSSFINVNTNYSHYNADFGTGRTVNLDAIAGTLFMQNSLQFGKAWTAELSGFYTTPNVYQGSFKGKTIWNVDAGLQKQLMKGKATVKASVSDIFHTQKFRGSTDFAGQKGTFTQYGETRLFKLNLVYRFGSNQIKAARQRNSGSEEENKRVQSSGGLIGN